jgi:GMP reductase
MEIFDYDNILLLPQVPRGKPLRMRRQRGAGRPHLPPAGGARQHEDGGGREDLHLLAQNGYFYVMHRFDIDNVAFTKDMQSQGLFASISLGVKQADYDTVDRFVADGICPSTSPSTSPTAMPTA